MVKFLAFRTRLIPACYFERRDYQGDARTGLLVTFYAWRDPIGSSPGINLTKEYSRLQKELSEESKFSASLQKRVLLHINYTDRIGINRNTIYEIYPTDIGHGPQVPAKRKLSINSWQFYNLNSLTAANLFDRWDSFEELTEISIRGA